jgi:O-antigen/teichoic acid export membrane protein
LNTEATTRTASPPLKSVLKGEAKDALVFSGSNLLNKFGTIFLLPLYWRKLTPSDYGILAIIAMIGLFQTLLGTLSLDLSITRFFYQWNDEERRANLGALWVWSWLGSILTTGISLLAMWKTATWIFPNAPYFPYLFLGIINTGITNLFIIPFTTIRMRRMPWLFAAYNLGNFVISTSLGIWFVLILGKGLYGFLISGILANTAFALFGAAVMLRFSTPRLTSPGLMEAVRFSLPTLPSNLLGTCTASLDRFLLNYFASLETLGIYAVAMRFIEAMNNLHTSLKMAYGPFMMKHLSKDKEKGGETVSQITPYYMLPYFAAALGLSLFVRDFVHIAGKAEYFPVVNWVPWLAGISILNILYFYYTNGLFLANKTAMLSIPALANLAALGLSGLLLIKEFQLGGLVISRYFAGVIFFSVNLYLSQKVFPLPHRWNRLAILAILAGSMAAIGAVVHLPHQAVDFAFRVLLFLAFIASGFFAVAGRSSLSQLRRYLPASISKRIPA